MTQHSAKRRVAVVAGVGPGNGKALAKRFAQAGYMVAMLGRDRARLDVLAAEIDGACAYACDVGNTASVAHAFASIRSELGEVDSLLYNAGSGVFADIEEITPDQFEASWRVNALGGLLCSQQVIPAMVAAERGSIVFIGATASRRGGIKTAAFAPAKAAQRSLAEAMAKALWPKGIHVAVVILDGMVDTPEARKMAPNRPVDGFVAPTALAETAWMLTEQNRQAWSFEVEARPSSEPW